MTTKIRGNTQIVAGSITPTELSDPINALLSSLPRIIADDDIGGNDNLIIPANFPALSGDISTIAGSSVTTIGAGKVTNAMLAGSIAFSKLIGTDITTLGTIATGIWNAGAVTSSSTILSSVNGAVGMKHQPATATNFALFECQNTGGIADIGIDNSTGGVFGSTAYTFAFNYNGTAGVLFQASNVVSGTIRFATGGTNLRATLQTTGTWTWAAYGAGAITSDASGNLTSVSDRRFKNRISSLKYGLKEVLKLKPIQHGYNKLSKLERKHLYGGFIAQEVKKYMPLAVGRDQRGYLTLADRPITGAVVNAIKELNARLAALERNS